MLEQRLRVVLAVAQHLQFAKAGEELGLSPSTVSRAVRDAEGSLGVRLFHRTTRRVSLTPDGERFVARLRALSFELDAAAAELMDQTQAVSGVVRVSCSVAFGQAVVMPALVALAKLYPELEFDLLTTDRRVDLVGEQVDVAFRHGALPDSDDIARRLTTVAYGLYAKPGLVQEEGLDGLTGMPVLTFAAKPFARSWELVCDHLVHRHCFVPRLRCAGALPLIASCEAGLGVAVLPGWAAGRRVDEGTLVRVMPQWHVRTPSPVVWAVTPGRRYLPARVHAIIDAVGDLLG